MIVSLKRSERPDPSMVVRVGNGQAPVVRQDIVMPEHRAAARPQAAPRSARSRVPGFVLLIAIALGVLIVVGLFASFTSRGAVDPTHMSQSDIDALVAHVGALVLLPQGEVPTIATVTDLAALKGQAFFANAVLGDKVLMYPKAQEAILYDPQADKVIQIAPLTVTGTR